MSQEPEHDWRKTADVAQSEMVRQALSLITTANLIRVELGHDLLQVRQLRQSRRPKRLPAITDEEWRATMREENEWLSREGGVH